MDFSCRELNKKPEYIPITFKLSITNNTPQLYNNNDNAIKRRIILYEFPHSPFLEVA
jgi:phage/plasmid-associated DNA primase